jgi:serine/threonine protein kinase/tetratricopeptide (TPR) repeat protein
MATRCPSCRTENSDTANFCSNCATSLRDTKTQGDVLGVTRTIESQAWDLTTGITFGGRYQIIEQLGRGGMGRVYRALDTKTREEVAVKLIRPDIASDKRTLERFVNEITLAHRVSHRNIGRMYHLGEDQGIHYITMEYVPGEDLKSFIRRSRRLDIGTTVAIAKQVCGGLSEAHAAGIVHRDLKPGNIMIDKEGNAKILDFGIARAVGTQGVTADGIIIGTPEYMSPEQVEGKDSDRRSDIYSFGVILFEMVTGRLPFSADTPFAIAFKQQSERPPRPEDLNPQTPPQLGAIILKCLEKDREKRYQSTEEICLDLGQVEETIQTATAPVARRRPTTRKTRLTANLPFPWRKALIPALVFVGIMAAGVVVREIIPKAKGSVHTLAVVGFENLTGDASYEYLKKAIPNLLITSLEQSRYLDVMSWERLNDLAGRRSGTASPASEQDIWFEICRREGIEALVLGSFTKAENLFATDAKVYDVPTKNLLKSVGSRGEGVGSILRNQIDELSREISKGVGLTERAAIRGTIPITEVTTASMDAYESFLKGQEDFDRYYYEEARQSLEQAVQKDPQFALAYFYLARANQGLADAPAATRALDQFKKLSKRDVSALGKDGLYVSALSRLMDKDTEGFVKGLTEVIRTNPKDKRALVDLATFYRKEKRYADAIPLFGKALEIDPDFGYALNNLAYAYAETGETDKAIKTFDRYAAARPGDANPLDSMGDLYFLTGNFPAARLKYEQALAIRPEFPSSWKLAYLHAMEGDYDQALRWVDHIVAHATTVGLKAEGHQWKGFYYSFMGRIKESLSELDAAIELARASGNTGLADAALRDALWVTYDWDRTDLCRAYLDKRLAYLAESGQGTPSLLRVYKLLYPGLRDGKAGDTAAARTKLEEIVSLSRSTGDTDTRNGQLAAGHLKREILFAEGGYDDALKVFRDGPPITVSINVYPSVLQKNLPLIDDFAARVYLKKGERDKALAEYERLVSPEARFRDMALIHPFNRVRLGALYEAKGDLDRAVEQFGAAVKVWRDADADLPEVMSARKRLAVLKPRTAQPKSSSDAPLVPLLPHDYIGSR